MKDKSIFDTGVEITQQDTILTLSTCTNQENDTRYAVHAKLLSKLKTESPDDLATD